MSKMQFGAVQLRIMQVLWDSGATSAKEMTEALNQESEIAHSTVQTLLRQLEEKGAVGHRQEGRTFLFYSLADRDRVTHSETRQLMDRLFGGSPGGLMAYLLKQEKISRKELDQIKQLIEEKEGKA